MNSKKQKIKVALEDAPIGLNQRELAEATSLSVPTVKKAARELIQQEEVFVIKKGASKIYLKKASKAER